MQTPVISVLIPTRNRCDVLLLTLQALDRQEGLDGRFGVVVVDDGSNDATLEMLRKATFSKFNLKTVALEHGGPARARNRGIAEVSAERVLLLGDDTIPEAGTLVDHLAAAGGRDIGIQGMIDWDPAVGVTDVMRFLAPEGPQFWFKGLEEGSAVPWTSVVSSNLSAPTKWFVDEPFDERFTDACLEDTELAWRWDRRGWRVRFSPSAMCLHRHRYESILPFLQRQRRAGRWARHAVLLHPGLMGAVVLKPLVLVPAIGARAAWRAMCRRGRRTDRWDLACRMAFLRGLFSSRSSPGGFIRGFAK